MLVDFNASKLSYLQEQITTICSN